MNTHKSYNRYQRQILLKEFGIPAQEKLQHARVLIIGAGGLGCPVLQYLAAAGVGAIGIVDSDVVSLTNLHRQVLYNMDDIGLPKAQVAAKKLRALNDEINIIAYNILFSNENALSIIKGYDVVVDGTDNFSSRYMINDACVLQNKPLVYGAVSRFEGQVAVLNVRTQLDKRAINYRDLFPVPPKDSEVLNCDEAGVLGILPGIIGTMQASETIKLITSVGEPLFNKMITYNALTNSFYEFNLSVNEEAQSFIPKDAEAFLKTNYEQLCASQINSSFEIEAAKLNSFIEDDDTIIIDVREKNEEPLVDEFEHIKIPLSNLMNEQGLIQKNTVVAFCQSGKRSLQAVQFLNEIFSNKKVYSLKGGIVEWKNKYGLQKIIK